MLPRQESATVRVSGDLAVSAILEHPGDAFAGIVLAHGAGAGMRHRFMEQLAAALAGRGLAVFRYQFPYVEAGRRRVDPAPLLEQTVRAACEAAHLAWPELPLFAGGKSLGARMSSRAAASPPALEVRGLVFFGFPLHRPGEPATERAAHLSEVPVPMLFVQGTRDALAELGLIRGVTARLPLASLHVVPAANHGFEVPKSSERTNAQVLHELADVASTWSRLQSG